MGRGKKRAKTEVAQRQSKRPASAARGKASKRQCLDSPGNASEPDVDIVDVADVAPRGVLQTSSYRPMKNRSVARSPPPVYG
jgi:hypothetical protein